ncbi:MAG: electron transport complex subunit RsxC [Deltaproteobacteria bacterium]|nr:electron transport complex subunit RsxC [Deltaproteobacteria bacterium]
MRAVSFKGGVHPSYSKDRSSDCAISELPAPDEIAIPLSQHIGAPAKPCVGKGDEVLIGQPVGEPAGFVSVPVHSSVSGKVKAIEPRPGAMGQPVMSVIVTNDGEDRQVDFEGLGDSWKSADAGDIKELIKNAGLVGMGGAAFPSHVKLSPPPDKPIDTLILNGAECEPYLTADHRVMVERPADVLTGLQIAAKVLGAEKLIVGIERNKPDALDAISAAAEGTRVEVVALKVKYPQGAEKQLIDACLERQVPSAGLPMDVGVVVHNVGTSTAIADAVVAGRPLFKRVVTVTGAMVAEPANLTMRVGTPVAVAIERCKGDLEGTGKLILGGPMMGFTQHTDQVPVTKGTSGILLLAPEDVDTREPGACIRCGRCVEACPMRLVPTDIANLGSRGMYDDADKADALDCIECGSCAFDCPARLPLVQEIRLAKAAIMAAKRKQG